MQREGEEFRSFVYPATIDEVQRAARGPRRPAWWPISSKARGRRWHLGLAAAAAAAASLIVLFVPAGREEGYVGIKGSPLGFAAYVGTSAGARGVRDGARVPAAGTLRFRVRASSACHLWIVSVDATGQVSPLYPADGRNAAVASGPTEVSGGAILDGKPGPERLYATCTSAPLSYVELRRAVGRAVARGDEGVRRAGALQSLPSDAAQATLLLEKTP